MKLLTKPLLSKKIQRRSKPIVKAIKSVAPRSRPIVVTPQPVKRIKPTLINSVHPLYKESTTTVQETQPLYRSLESPTPEETQPQTSKAYEELPAESSDSEEEVFMDIAELTAERPAKYTPLRRQIIKRFRHKDVDDGPLIVEYMGRLVDLILKLTN